MSCSHSTVTDMVRPSSARVLVTELSGSRQINPNPAEKASEDTETALEICLSPEKLESLCGTWDLSGVTSLEFSINTQENSLGNIGAFLPNLVQLKLNKSVIMSVRDLGMSLPRLQVLWMCRCCLRDLDGIFNFTALKELYVAYNHVSDLNHIGMLENLQLLDLEGNDVEELVQIQYLGLCRKLRTLTLEGNPVCVRPAAAAPQTSDYKYRAAVRELLPQLRYLDNLSVEEQEKEEEEKDKEEEEEESRTSCSSILGTEWDVLRNVIRDCGSTLSAAQDVETAESGTIRSRPGSAWSLDHRDSSLWPLPSTPGTGSRPTSGSGVLSPHASRPGSADTYGASVDETSILTHGAGKILFCGNPIQALRAKHEKLRELLEPSFISAQQTAPTKSTFTPRDLPIHVPEHTYDTEEPNVRDRSDVIAELKSWREKHSRRLQAIETERSPQILSIQHSNLAEEEEDDDDDDYNDEDNGETESDSYDGEKQHGSLNKTRPSSRSPSLQSLSPDHLYHRESLILDVTKLSLSPDVRLSPSPPVQAEAAPPSGVPKPQGVRARRLRHSLVNLEQLPNANKEACSLRTAVTEGDTRLLPPKVRTVTRTDLSLSHPDAHPLNLPSAEGSIDSGLDMELPYQRRRSPQLPKLPGKLATSRPHTARAALQIHQQRHVHRAHSGPSQQD